MAAYKRLIPAAKQYGVKVCLENLFVHRGMMPLEAPCADGAEACLYVDTLNEAAGEDLFGFCFDVGHANLLGRKIGEFVKTLGHRLTILHIHDNNGFDDMHMIPYSYLATPSSHVCDWQGFVEGLKEIGYKGVLAFETFRIYSAYPAPCRDAALKLISSIGHYWANCIDDPNWPAAK